MKENLIGNVFNRLTVIEQLSSDLKGKRRWLCQCNCGGTSVVRTESLKGDHVKSCGCLRSEKSKMRMTKHGLRSHSLYHTWLNMRDRCNNPNNKDWLHYGGRGIVVCDEWDDFSVFLSDMGDKKTKELTLERVDGDGNYCKENCIWATMLTQARNISLKSNNKSGINGVSRYETVTPSGKIYAIWKATWCDDNGKGCNKTFNIEKLGEEAAKEAAINHRIEQIRLLEVNFGIIYSERHGL